MKQYDIWYFSRIIDKVSEHIGIQNRFSNIIKRECLKFRQFQTEGIIPYQRGSGYIKSVLHPMLKIVLRVERNLKRVKRGNGKENSWRYMSRMWYLKMLVVMYLLLSYPWYKYIIITIFCIDISKMVHKRVMRIRDAKYQRLIYICLSFK